MAVPIRSIEIYVPLDSNDSLPFPESKYTSLQQELLSRFGGVTSVQRQFPLQGAWPSGAGTYYDRVVVFAAMDFHEGTQLECLRYLGKLKGRLKKRFDQLEILSPWRSCWRFDSQFCSVF
jgi:hypothetical protein